MREADDEWVALGIYPTGAGRPAPKAAIAAWLSECGVAGMPLADDEIRIDALCGRNALGEWSQECRILVNGDACRRLGVQLGKSNDR